MGQRSKVSENNVIQLLADYAQSRYGEEIVHSVEECRWDLDFDDPELAYKQHLSWFIFERINPSTGKTVLEEFVEQFIRDNDLAKKVLRTQELIADTFIILENSGNTITVQGESSARKYRVMVVPENAPIYIPGRRVKARIFPWGDVYRFAGITKVMKTDEELARETGIITPELMVKWYEKEFIEKAESIVIRKNSSLQSMLNKIPADWIDGICFHLLISRDGRKAEKMKRIVSVLSSQRLKDIICSLPEDALKALTHVAKHGGVIRYGEMVKMYGGADMSLWWEKNTPKTPAGILRMHGLLIVGRMLKGDRFYKVAVVPKEILSRLADFPIVEDPTEAV